MKAEGDKDDDKDHFITARTAIVFGASIAMVKIGAMRAWGVSTTDNTDNTDEADDEDEDDGEEAARHAARRATVM